MAKLKMRPRYAAGAAVPLASTIAGAAIGGSAKVAGQGNQSVNQFQGTQMGASLFAVNPIAGAVGTVVGLGYDLIAGRKKAEQEQAANQQIAEQQWQANNVDPYEAEGGYMQGIPTFRKGGKVKMRVKPKAKMRAYQDGGAVDADFEEVADEGVAGHVVPAVRTPRAVADASRVGVNMDRSMGTGDAFGVVDGRGEGTEDDVAMAPGRGGDSLLSSREAYAEDDLMAKMARGVGMGIAEYQRAMYPSARPDAEGRKRFQVGGPVGGDPVRRGRQDLFTPEGLPIDASTDYARDRARLEPPRPGASGYIETVLGELANPNPGPSSLPASLKARAGFGVPGTDMTSPSTPFMAGQEDTTGFGIPGTDFKVDAGPVPDQFGSGPADAEKGPGPYADLDRASRTGTLINLGMGLGSLAWNLFSRREPGRAPTPYNFRPLDLRTGQLRAGLDADRQRGVRFALNQTRNKQGLGRDLGILSGNLDAQRRDALTVEEVENRERIFNTEGANRVDWMNTQARNRFQEQEVAAQNQFRLMKGQHATMSLAGISRTIGNRYSDMFNISALERLDRDRTNREKMEAGDPETENWTSLPPNNPSVGGFFGPRRRAKGGAIKMKARGAKC